MGFPACLVLGAPVAGLSLPRLLLPAGPVDITATAWAASGRT